MPYSSVSSSPTRTRRAACTPRYFEIRPELLIAAPRPPGKARQVFACATRPKAGWQPADCSNRKKRSGCFKSFLRQVNDLRVPSAAIYQVDELLRPLSDDAPKFNAQNRARRVEVDVVAVDNLNWHRGQLFEVCRRIDLWSSNRRHRRVLRRYIGRRCVGRESESGWLVSYDGLDLVRC